MFMYIFQETQLLGEKDGDSTQPVNQMISDAAFNMFLAIARLVSCSVYCYCVLQFSIDILSIGTLGEVKIRYGSGPLIFENSCTRAGNLFFLLRISY